VQDVPTSDRDHIPALIVLPTLPEMAGKWGQEYETGKMTERSRPFNLIRNVMAALSGLVLGFR
jgi:hypothetical protein